MELFDNPSVFITVVILLGLAAGCVGFLACWMVWRRRGKPDLSVPKNQQQLADEAASAGFRLPWLKNLMPPMLTAAIVLLIVLVMEGIFNVDFNESMIVLVTLFIRETLGWGVRVLRIYERKFGVEDDSD